MMLAPKVRRSTIAAQSRGSVKVLVQPEKDSLEAIATELVSSRSVRTWKSSSAPRGLVRDGGDAEAIENWHAWMSEELPFLAADRPWERANIIVSGTPQLDHDPVNEVVVAPLTPNCRQADEA
jgi:hypothetical protein